MKIKLDENIPSRLVGILSSLGHTVDTVAMEGLKGENDAAVLNAAKREWRFLITQDLDFSDIRNYVPQTHGGILILRLRNPGRKVLLNRIKYIFENENVESWKKCLVVVTEIKIRIRHLLQQDSHLR